MKRLLIALIGCVACIGSLAGQEKGYFNNPVIHADMADPSILRIGKTYYATGTSSEWAPFYPVFTSTDLVNWKQTGHLFNKQPEWTQSSFWAPELYYYNNKVYAFYTARRKSDGISYIGVATANKPTDEFTDHGLIVEFGKEAIDAFVLEDNGQLYMTWKAYGLDNRPIEILCSKLSDDGLQLVGEPFTLLRDDDRTMMEGQQWFKKGDYYYLIYAANGCCGPNSDYAVHVARSKKLEGPYEKYEGNPILHGDDEILSCGHGTITTTPDGRMFYLFHAYLTGAGFFGGRQPVLQEIVIGDDNWPHFTTGDIATIRQSTPFKNTVQQPVSDFDDTFNGKTLKVDWNWNYVYSDINTKIEKGNLLLSGTPKKDNLHGTALCLRPVSSDYSVETQVVNTNNSLKGLTMYGDNKNLIVLGCSGNRLMISAIVDNKEQILNEVSLPVQSAYLRMNVSNGNTLSFFWSQDGKRWTQLNVDKQALDSLRLTPWDRVSRVGLIHRGDANQPAEFAYFKMLNTKK